MRTRREALTAALAASAAVALRPAAALAATDEGPLSALVAFQQEVVFGYEVALSKAAVTGARRATLERFRHDASQAAAALREALKKAGGTPSPPPSPASAPPPSDSSVRGYLRDLITAEESAVASFYAALGTLTGKRHLAGSAAFMAQGGRRLVVLRQMTGEPLLPRAFETGSS